MFICVVSVGYLIGDTLKTNALNNPEIKTYFMASEDVMLFFIFLLIGYFTVYFYSRYKDKKGDIKR